MSNDQPVEQHDDTAPFEPFDDQFAEPIVPEGWTTGGQQVSQPQPEAAEAPVPAPAEPEAPAAPAEAESQPEPAPAPAEEDRPVTVVSGEELTKLKNRLRAEAEREIIEAHRAEYHKVAEAKFAAHGLEFTRRMTKEERAKEQLEKLLAENPSLRNAL